MGTCGHARSHFKSVKLSWGSLPLCWGFRGFTAKVAVADDFSAYWSIEGQGKKT